MSIAARKIRLIMSLRRNGIDDTAVLSALERVPRERFVPTPFQDQAYEDRPLPIGQGQTISQPLMVGLMTQALRLTKRHRVLEIGTGCGYQTAVLAQLAARVYTMERHRALLAGAEARFRELALVNIEPRFGDGWLGWPEQAPFDRILVTAAAEAAPPPALLDQLAVDGVLILPLGGPLGDDRREQVVCRFERGPSGFHREDLWPVRFVPLIAGLPEERPSPPVP